MKHPFPTSVLLAGSLGMLALSGFLMLRHVQALRATRESALPLAADLVPLEERANILKQQADLSTAQDGLRSSSAQEKLHVYVLPQGSDLTRTLGLLDAAQTTLRVRGSIASLSPITVGGRHPPSIAGAKSLEAQELSFTLTGTAPGIDTFLSLIDLSGTLTVGDALTGKERDALMTLTESQNYAGIVTVEQFLNTDLLAYARNHQAFEDKVTQALPSESFLSRFHEIVHASRLKDAADTLGGPLGDALGAGTLWPAQFLRADRVTTKELADGSQEAEVTVVAYSRSE